MTDRLLKTRDVAEVLGVYPDTVLDAWERGDLPIFWPLYGRKGGPLRCWESDLEAWLAEKRSTLGVDNQTPGRPRRGSGPAPGGISSDAPRILRPVRE